MVVTHPPKVRRNNDNISRNEPRLEMVGAISRQDSFSLECIHIT